MYSAKSSVAVLFMVHTKKLLFLGVRNKHCSICAVFASVSCITQKQEPPKHQCYKKRNRSSLAMESDIISEGFRLSKSMYMRKWNRPSLNLSGVFDTSQINLTEPLISPSSSFFNNDTRRTARKSTMRKRIVSEYNWQHHWYLHLAFPTTTRRISIR